MASRSISRTFTAGSRSSPPTGSRCPEREEAPGRYQLADGRNLYQDLKKAIRQHSLPDKVTIDQSGANTAALAALKKETGQAIEIRQSKCVNNLVEQDHRAIKRIVRPRLGFNSFPSAKVTLPGIELMHMLKKGPMIAAHRQHPSAAGQFYSLAA